MNNEHDRVRFSSTSRRGKHVFSSSTNSLSTINFYSRSSTCRFFTFCLRRNLSPPAIMLLSKLILAAAVCAQVASGGLIKVRAIMKLSKLLIAAVVSAQVALGSPIKLRIPPGIKRKHTVPSKWKLVSDAHPDHTVELRIGVADSQTLPLRVGSS